MKTINFIIISFLILSLSNKCFSQDKVNYKIISNDPESKSSFIDIGMFYVELADSKEGTNLHHLSMGIPINVQHIYNKKFVGEIFTTIPYLDLMKKRSVSGDYKTSNTAEAFRRFEIGGGYVFSYKLKKQRS
jgi:hypothetical protein